MYDVLEQVPVSGLGWLVELALLAGEESAHLKLTALSSATGEMHLAHEPESCGPTGPTVVRPSSCITHEKRLVGHTFLSPLFFLFFWVGESGGLVLAYCMKLSINCLLFTHASCLCAAQGCLCAAQGCLCAQGFCWAAREEQKKMLREKYQTFWREWEREVFGL